MAGLLILLLHFSLKMRRIKQEEESKEYAHFRRNIIIREHVHGLQLLVLISAIMALAGFAHLLIDYVFKTGSTWLRTGGFASLATAIGGWIFTSVKAAPAPSSDKHTKPTLSVGLVCLSE